MHFSSMDTRHGINCAFCTIVNIWLCSFWSPRLCAFLVLDLAQRRRDAKGGVKLWLHIQLTLMQKSSIVAVRSITAKKNNILS